MTSRTSTEGIARLSDIPIPDEGPLTPQQGVEAFRRAVAEGREWYPALLEVIARWVAPEEEVDGVRLHYLIAGEAFDGDDWLVAAGRGNIQFGDHLQSGIPLGDDAFGGQGEPRRAAESPRADHEHVHVATHARRRRKNSTITASTSAAPPMRAKRSPVAMGVDSLTVDDASGTRP